MREGISVDHQQWPTGRRWCVPAQRTSRGVAPGARSLSRRMRIAAQPDPGRGVIAGALSTTNLTIDARADKAVRGLGAQQQMIDTKARVPRPSVSHVVPERVHRRIRMQLADCVNPALLENALKKNAAFQLNERAFRQAL